MKIKIGAFDGDGGTEYNIITEKEIIEKEIIESHYYGNAIEVPDELVARYHNIAEQWNKLQAELEALWNQTHPKT